HARPASDEAADTGNRREGGCLDATGRQRALPHADGRMAPLPSAGGGPPGEPRGAGCLLDGVGELPDFSNVSLPADRPRPSTIGLRPWFELWFLRSWWAFRPLRPPRHT